MPPSKKGPQDRLREVLRMVLRRCLALGSTGRKGSEKGSQKVFSEGGFRKGTQKAETRLFAGTTPFAHAPN